MDYVTKTILAALRTSELYVLVAQAYIEAMHMPVPMEYKGAGWAYIAFRVVSKVVKFVFPNPDNPQGGWVKPD